MGRVSGRVADQIKGGFLDDVDGEIVSAIFRRGSFVGDDGETVTKTQAELEVAIEGREDPVKVFLGAGSGNIVAPFTDPECTDEAEEGQYLGGAGGKDLKGVNELTGWGRFQAQLVTKCKFPDANFDRAIEDALVGLRGHWTSLPGGKFKGKAGKPVPVLATIEKDSIPGAPGTKAKKAKSAGGGLGKLKAKSKPAPVEEEEAEVEEVEEDLDKKFPKVKAKAAVKAKAKVAPVEEEAEVEEEEEEDIEAAVGAAIIAAVKKAPLPKGQLAQRVGKVFDGKDNRSEAVQLSMSDKFLKAGMAEGLWSYDGRTIGAADEADAE